MSILITDIESPKNKLSKPEPCEIQDLITEMKKCNIDIPKTFIFSCKNNDCDNSFTITKNTRTKCVKCNKIQVFRITPIRKRKKDNIDDLIDKTKSITLGENLYLEKPPKKLKINTFLVYPDENKPNINKSIQLVDTIDTKYVSVIEYCFKTKPFCKHWDNHFNKSLKDDKMESHLDIFSFYFMFSNYNNCFISNLVESNTFKKNNNDIIILFENDITFVLREKSYTIFDKNVLKKIMFVTHCPSQYNIYKTDLYNSEKTWILHLILNEKNIRSNNDSICFSNNIKKIKIHYSVLLEALYLFFSKNNI